MTEYEYASLFVAFLEAANVVFANYMALTFAMLTASYFLAQRLTRSMSLILLLVYSLWAINLVSGVFGAFSDFSKLGLTIHELYGELPETSLGWLGPVAAKGSIGYMEIMPNLMLFMCALVYVVSIIFFFVARAESGPGKYHDIDPEPSDRL